MFVMCRWVEQPCKRGGSGRETILRAWRTTSLLSSMAEWLAKVTAAWMCANLVPLVRSPTSKRGARGRRCTYERVDALREPMPKLARPMATHIGSRYFSITL